MKYTLGALVLIGAVVALQRADRALPDGARGAATGASFLLLLALAEHRRRRCGSRGVDLSAEVPLHRPSLPSIHEIEVPYPKQRCAKCGEVIHKDREGDVAVLVAAPERLRYYHRGCAPTRGA